MSSWPGEAGKTSYLEVSVRMFPEEISIWISRWSKEDHPSPCGWASSDPLGAWPERRRRGQLTLCLSGDVLLLPLQMGAPGPWAFRLRPELVPLASWSSGLRTELQHQLSGFSSLRVAGVGLPLFLRVGNTFILFLATPFGMWDLISLTRDWICAPYSGR